MKIDSNNLFKKYISGEFVFLPGYDSSITLERFMQVRRYNLIVQLIKKYSKDISNFLDAGCGAGIYIDSLPRSIYAIGIDLFKGNLNKAKERNRWAEFIEANLTNMPLEDNSIDLCLCSEVIEHLPDQNKIMMEIRRVIKKGGHLIISTPSKYSIYETKEFCYLHRFILGTKRFLRGNSFKKSYEPHISLQSWKELKSRLKIFGFEIVEEYSTGFCLPLMGEFLNIFLKLKFFWKIYEVLDKRLFSKLFRNLCFSIIIVCKLNRK